jgi:hypothetical protein
MYNFLTKVKIAWKFATSVFVGTPFPDDYWLLENAREWSNFLTGDTGTKIRWKLRNRVADTAFRAIMEMTDKSQYLAGYAAGVRGTVVELDSLLDLAKTKEGFALSEEDIKALAERELLTK